MSHELHYTSVPSGLKPGTRGFCTVACTAGLPGPLADRLESLSGYRQLFPPGDPGEALNPVAWSHLVVPFAGRMLDVLSRVGFAGLDYSDRANKYAHHVVLDGDERPLGGPAWVMSQPGFMETSWTGEPAMIPRGRLPAPGDRPPAVCEAWRTATGDAGWAGVLAESFLRDPLRPVALVFRPGQNVLDLFVEALSLLPAQRRWGVSFSTYFTSLPQGLQCAWRGVLEGSSEHQRLAQGGNILVIPLSDQAGAAEGGELVSLARTGEAPSSRGLRIAPDLPLADLALAPSEPLPSSVPTSSMASGDESAYVMIPKIKSRKHRHKRRAQGRAPARDHGRRLGLLLLLPLLLATLASGGYFAVRKIVLPALVQRLRELAPVAKAKDDTQPKQADKNTKAPADKVAKTNANDPAAPADPPAGQPSVAGDPSSDASAQGKPELKPSPHKAVTIVRGRDLPSPRSGSELGGSDQKPSNMNELFPADITHITLMGEHDPEISKFGIEMAPDDSPPPTNQAFKVSAKAASDFSPTFRLVKIRSAGNRLDIDLIDNAEASQNMDILDALSHCMLRLDLENGDTAFVPLSVMPAPVEIKLGELKWGTPTQPDSVRQPGAWQVSAEFDPFKDKDLTKLKRSNCRIERCRLKPTDGSKDKGVDQPLNPGPGGSWILDVTNLEQKLNIWLDKANVMWIRLEYSGVRNIPNKDIGRALGTAREEHNRAVELKQEAMKLPKYEQHPQFADAIAREKFSKDQLDRLESLNSILNSQLQCSVVVDIGGQPIEVLRIGYPKDDPWLPSKPLEGEPASPPVQGGGPAGQGAARRQPTSVQITPNSESD